MRKYEYFDVRARRNHVRWLDIYLHGATDPYILQPGSVLETVRPAVEGDWKTAIAHHIPPIPEGTEIVVKDIFQNFEGVWIAAEYNGRTYSVNPRDCKYVRLGDD